MKDQIRHCSGPLPLPERIVTNWRRRSSRLRLGLERDTRFAAPMNRKTFSESFSKWVRNGSSMKWPSYLILFEKSRILASKNGHEPPDSDLRLQFQTLFGEGVTNSQSPSASKSASNFLTREQPDKSPKVLRHELLKRNWLCVWCS